VQLDLLEIQKLTGQHAFEGFDEETDLNKLGYESTKSLNNAGSTLSIIKEILQASFLMLEKTREWDIAVKSHISKAAEAKDIHRTIKIPLFTEKSDKWMKSKFSHLKDYSSAMLGRVGNKQNLIQLLHQAVRLHWTSIEPSLLVG
jgi:hypothetical protein